MTPADFTPTALPDEVREAAVKIMQQPRMHTNMSGDKERAVVDALTPLFAAHFAAEAVRESHSRELHHFETEDENATLRAERDALAAQIEQVLSIVGCERYSGGWENCDDDMAEGIGGCIQCQARHILTASPASVVARIREEAWDEGGQAATDYCWNMHTPSGIPLDPPANPYRQEAEK